MLAAIALGGLLYSLANYNALHGLIYSLLPVVDKARSASMAIFLFGFGASILAALGLNALFYEHTSPWLRRAALTAVGLGVLVFGYRFIIISTQGMAGAAGEQRSLMTGLAALLLALWLQGLRQQQIGWRAAALCALLLFVVEVSSQNSFYQPHVFEKERMARLNSLKEHGDIARFLRQQPGLPRVDVDSNLIGYNFGDWYGIPTASGYLASLTQNVHNLGTHEPVVKRLLGISYAIGKEPTQFQKEEVFTGSSGLKVYHNPDVLPRAFAVHEVTQVNDRTQFGAELNRIAPELGRKAFVTSTPPTLVQCGGQEDVWVRSYSSGRVQLTATLPCRGMVVLADTYFPGWIAKVDGKTMPIYEVDGLVRGVVCEAGTHGIRVVYRPLSVLLGGTLSFASLLVAAAALVIIKRGR
ncbi:MAG: hypothetical protein QM757_32655 [Paludibaculum sp.]